MVGPMRERVIEDEVHGPLWDEERRGLAGYSSVHLRAIDVPDDLGRREE